MLRHASEGVILADHSKFEKRALVLLHRWAPDLTLITDKHPPVGLMGAIHENRSSLVVAPPDE